MLSIMFLLHIINTSFTLNVYQLNEASIYHFNEQRIMFIIIYNHGQ